MALILGTQGGELYAHSDRRKFRMDSELVDNPTFKSDAALRRFPQSQEDGFISLRRLLRLNEAATHAQSGDFVALMLTLFSLSPFNR